MQLLFGGFFAMFADWIRLTDLNSMVECFDLFLLNVTGSEKRYIVAHTMIFLYKRFCSKTRNIFYSLKKIFFWA